VPVVYSSVVLLHQKISSQLLLVITMSRSSPTLFSCVLTGVCLLFMFVSYSKGMRLLNHYDDDLNNVLGPYTGPDYYPSEDSDWSELFHAGDGDGARDKRRNGALRFVLPGKRGKKLIPLKYGRSLQPGM